MGLNNFFRTKKEKKGLQEPERNEQREEYPEQERLEERELEVRRLSEDVVWFKRLMAHNIRMPLAIIVGYGELLANGSLATREEELDCIKKICSNIDYLDTLSKVLLDDSQEELLLQKEYFDVLDCVRKITEYFFRIAQRSNVSISVNSSREVVMLFGNRIALMRVFFNMIENSFRYMNREGSIFITVEETEKEVLIVYRDDGEGMRADEAEHITELNYQGSNKKMGGHGVGMYLIKQTIEEHEGKLEIKTGQGKGMGIYMSFPKFRQKNL